MKNKTPIAISIFSIALLLAACGSSDKPGSQDTIDSLTVNSPGNKNSLQEKKIGTQTWLVKNLDVIIFRNGDTIPEAKTEEAWKKAGEESKPAWCNFDNNAANDKQFGKLYNWFAVNDPRGLAPAGWHIPSASEWTTLVDFLGGEYGTKLKNNSGWTENGNGTNESGFAGLPGGFRQVNGKFTELGNYGGFWTSTEEGRYALARYLDSDSQGLGALNGDKQPGMSVRCVKD